MIIANKLNLGTINHDSTFEKPQIYNKFNSLNRVYRSDLISLSSMANPIPPDPYPDPNPPVIPPPEEHNTNLRMAALFGIPAVVLGTVGYFIGSALGSAAIGATIGAVLGPAAVMGFIIVKYFTS